MIREIDIVIYLFIWTPIFIIVSIMFFYVLWINGYLIKSRKTSDLFVGSLKPQNRCKFRFINCDGYIEKVVKARESRNYKFTFNSNITNGYVTAEIQGVNRRILLQLDKDNPESTINLEKNNRYYLVLRFEKAEGEFDLTWN